MSAGVLREHTVLVTGAAQGIGAATARRFAEEGARLLLTDLTAVVVEAAADIAADHRGSGAIGITADVTDPDACDGLVASALERHGGPDVLVVSGAVLQRGARSRSSRRRGGHLHEHPTRPDQVHPTILCRNGMKLGICVFDGMMPGRNTASMVNSKYRTVGSAVVVVLTSVLLAGCGGASAGSAPSTAVPTTPAPTTTPAATAATAAAFAQLEGRFHARLGVYVLDTGTGRTVTYQADQRFAFCSTYKALAAGVLLEHDTDAQLDKIITYQAADLVDYSPVTGQHVGTGMSLRDLLAAAIQQSDNTAANLLLAQLGGPGGLQRALRALGDRTTNVDRTEPTVNDVAPGDVRDTSSAAALGTDLRSFVLGDVLPAGGRQLLTNWLQGNTTGGPYIRAGVPVGWTVGDKTGNGGHGTRNDIAVVWPTGGAPIIVAVLSERDSANAASDDALIADATKTALAALH
ncbi:MAG TPA: class A beta-lactamase [Pseudonocardiaceae bacterium]|jgi:beta-lactamase class A|nr:class A beta-lactamase [Pseudonocardiaceae bacterium]